MAVLTNTLRTNAAIGNREQLSDIVDRIDPEDSPIYSDTKKSSFSGKFPEWETIGLNEPQDNAVEEGAEYNFEAARLPDRYGTYTQIMRKTGRISGSQNAENNAGSAEQIREQKVMAGIELRKDVELAIVSPVASVGGTTRRFGGLPTWITTNVSRGSGGANGGYNSTTKVTAAPTNGTQRAFSKAIVDDIMQQGYESGASFKNCYVSPYVKGVFATFMSDSNVAQLRQPIEKGAVTLNGDVEAYRSPHGIIMIQSNRVMSKSAAAARNAIFVDPRYLEFGWFRKLKEDKDAAKTKTGDADQFVILGEGAIKPRNEKGLGVAADLFGLTASS